MNKLPQVDLELAKMFARFAMVLFLLIMAGMLVMIGGKLR